MNKGTERFFGVCIYLWVAKKGSWKDITKQLTSVLEMFMAYSEFQGGNASAGASSRLTLTPTNVNIPSSNVCIFCKPFPVCFLVTTTITSFKNSLPYIL